jgi:hypothetical protein
MIDDALRVSKSEAYVASPSLFHNFDYGLNELTCKLTEGVKMEVYQFNKREVDSNNAISDKSIFLVISEIRTLIISVRRFH